MRAVVSRKHPIALKLIIVYWISLLIPYSLVGGQVSVLARHLKPIINHPTAMRVIGQLLELDEAPSLFNEHSHIGTSSRAKLMASYTPKSAPDPLCREELDDANDNSQHYYHDNNYRHYSGIQRFVRLANTSELADLLTNSMWFTFMVIGGIVFGIGSLILSWRVFWSVKGASQEEPVSIAFLLSIPGIRYLNNHIRYHMFDTPLHPRRRFASFVGTGAFKKFDPLHDDLDLDSNLNLTQNKKNNMEIIAPGKIRRRRESMLRHDVRSEELITPPSSTLPSLQNSSKTTPRRKSASKATSFLQGDSFSQDGTLSAGISTKRHSIANIRFNSDSPPSSSKLTSSPPTPVSLEHPSSEISITNDHSGRSSVTIIMEESHEDAIALKPSNSTRNEIERKLSLFSPEPVYSSSRVSLLENEPLESPEQSLRSQPSSQRSSFSEDHEETSRIITPISVDQIEGEVLTRTWHETEPFFHINQSGPAVSYRHPQLDQDSYPEARSTTSKLLRRFNEGANAPNQSKLSRYLVPQSTKSNPMGSLEMVDPITQRLYQGDLTPPPGFNGRPRNSHDVGLITAMKPALALAAPGMDVIEDDIVFTGFLGQGQQQQHPAPRRRASEKSTFELESKKVEERLDENKSLLFSRRWMLPESRENSTEHVHGEGMFNWHWISSLNDEGTDENHVDIEFSNFPDKTAFDSRTNSLWNDSIIPRRPHSTINDHSETISLPQSTLPAGSRSSGRITPRQGNNSQHYRAPRHSPSMINLGVFDDIFPRRPFINEDN